MPATNHEHRARPKSGRKRQQPIFRLATLVLLLGVAGVAAAAPRPRAVDRAITKLVAGLISRHHYAGRRLDDDISRQLFDEYFDRLDNSHSYFLAADIEQFRQHQLNLDDALLRGNLDFAYTVYERLLERARERLAFVRERLEQPFDFTRPETILLDHSDAPWSQTEAELNAIWRRRLKNNLIVYQIMETGSDTVETEEEEQDKEQDTPAPRDQADAPDPAKPETDAAPVADAGAAIELPARTPEERVLQFYERYLQQIEDRDSVEVLELYLTSLTRVFDPHSAYMAPDTEEDFDIAMKLSLQGIGALLTQEDEFVKVAGILPGGPAEFDERLKPGDRIVAVAQENEEPVNVIGLRLRRVVNLIRGTKGTRVFLTVIEAGKGLGSVPTVIDIVRDEVVLTEQEAALQTHELPGSVQDAAVDAGAAADTITAGVIALPSFYADFRGRSEGVKDYKSSTRDVKRLLQDVKREGVDGLLLDLRANGGGSLDEAISLAGLFIDQGPIVQVRDSSGRVKRRYDRDASTVYDGPLVVLVNRLSASASEILAAAIQDYGRGIIIGEGSTHGKGTVQTVYDLGRSLRRSPVFGKTSPGALKFTMAKFYRITGISTQLRGVTPDIVLPSFTDHMEMGEVHLPHAMPWDEIEALAFKSQIDIRRHIPRLQTLSQARRAQDPDFTELLADVEAFGVRRQRKTLTLERDKRIQLQKEEEEWSKRIRKINAVRRSRARGLQQDEEGAEDVLLAEALRVLRDLVLLESGQTVPVAEPLPIVAHESGSKTGPDAAATTTNQAD